MKQERSRCNMTSIIYIYIYISPTKILCDASFWHDKHFEPVLPVTGQTWLYVRGIGRHDIFFKMGITFLTLAFCFETFFGACFETFNSRPKSGNAARVNGFGVQSLERCIS